MHFIVAIALMYAGVNFNAHQKNECKLLYAIPENKARKDTIHDNTQVYPGNPSICEVRLAPSGFSVDNPHMKPHKEDLK